VPHLGYGLAVDAVLRRDPAPEAGYRAGPAPASLVLRSAVLGVAAGSRSSLGVAAPVLSTRGRAGLARALTGRAAGTLATTALAGEFVGDKLPQTPSRLKPPVLGVRLASGATGAVALARREGARPAAPAVAGLLGAAAGSFGGFAWRQWADRRVPDWQAAVAEDAVAVLLALVATLPGRASAATVPGGSTSTVEAPGAGAGQGASQRAEAGARAGAGAGSGSGEPPGPVPAGTSPGRGAPERTSRGYRPSPGTFPGLRPYRPSRRRDRRRAG
jgi:uncharacterized membrane protein